MARDDIDLTWWAIIAPNRQAILGAGTEEEAERYAGYLSRDLETSKYSHHEISDPTLIARLETGDDGVQLEDELSELGACAICGIYADDRWDCLYRLDELTEIPYDPIRDGLNREHETIYACPTCIAQGIETL